jgi:hypothetical protein
MLNRGEGGRGREETIKRGLDERYYCYEIFWNFNSYLTIKIFERNYI